MILLAMLFALGTGTDSTAAGGRLSVDSPVEGVQVFCDTTLLGVVPLREVAVPSGRHLLRYLHPQRAQWLHPVVAETLIVEEGANLERTARFQNICHVTSDPYGAEIRVRDSLLGRTPLYVPLDAAGMVTISLAGYLTATLPVAPELHAMLIPVEGGSEARPMFLSTEQSKSYTPVVAAAGATVLSGAAAAYFKIRADRSYDDYRRGGNVDLLDDVRRDDLLAGLSLAASQLSLVLLGYFLFSR